VAPMALGDPMPEDWRATHGPPLQVRPEAGDLILFNARKPHAIRRFSSGDRISVQSFIGHGQDRPLLLWN
jgi:hypothetical protein